MAPWVKTPPAMQETQEMQVQFLGQKGSLEEEKATPSSILAWRVSWTEEPGRLQSMGWQRVGHNWAVNNFTFKGGEEGSPELWDVPRPEWPPQICHCGGLVAKLCLTLVTPWTVASQAPLSMGFFRQEYWRGLPCPPPGDLPNPEDEPGLPHCRRILYHLSHEENPWVARATCIFWKSIPCCSHHLQ